MRNSMRMLVSCGALLASVNLAHGAVLANGGFEAAGVGGAGDSANWVEGGGGAAGNESIRIIGDAHSGDAHHRLAAFGNAIMGGAAVLLQNSVADGGMPPLTPGTAYTLSFYSKTDFGPGGVGFFAMRYLDGNGGIVYDSNLQALPQSTDYQLVEFTGDPAPASAVALFVEFTTNAGAFDGSYAIAQIDDVSVVPEPGMIGLLGAGALLALRRRR